MRVDLKNVLERSPLLREHLLLYLIKSVRDQDECSAVRPWNPHEPRESVVEGYRYRNCGFAFASTNVPERDRDELHIRNVLPPGS